MEYWISYLDQAIIFAIFAVSLNVLVGYAGIFSIGSAAFGAIGGYVTALVTLNLGAPTIVALLLAALAGGIIAQVLSAPILGLSPEYVMLMTLSLSILLVAVIAAVPMLGGQQGLFNMPLPAFTGDKLLRPSQFLPWLVLFLIVTLLLVWRTAESPLGRLLRAARDDRTAVRSLGKNPLWAQISAFGLMSALTGLAGGLLVLYNGIAAPSMFSLNQTMLIFAMVVIGGIGSIPGSLAGAVLVVGIAPLLETVLRLSPEDSALVRPIVFGAVLILVMRLRPAGLVPERLRVPRALRSRVAATVPEISEPRPAVVDTSERPPVVLQVDGISKSFGGVQAVRDLSLQLRAGQITALVGPNGAGKSTVFNLVTGAIQPDAGSVVLEGRDITGWAPHRVARAGMVRSFQDLRVFAGLTPIENVMMGGLPHPGENPLALYAAFRSVHRRERAIAQDAAAWLDFVGVDPMLRVPTSSLSFAQQKQVAFARVLGTGARILLLDEPLSGIEGNAAEDMIALIDRMRSLGHTICIVEHSIQAISRLADWAYFMEEGTVTAEGRVADLLADSRLKEAYFGIA